MELCLIKQRIRLYRVYFPAINRDATENTIISSNILIFGESRDATSWKTGVRIPADVKISSLRHRVQTGPGTHPAF
jgi:hypothetical protein